MNFTKITIKTTCDCFSDAEENLTDTFVRRVSRSGNLKDSDFKNHIERNRVVSELNSCEDICGYHGVSIEIWNEQSASLLKGKYLQTAIISPQFKKNLCVIKLKPNCGLIKHTPNQIEEYNEFHYDFYKDDDFLVSKIELIAMIPLMAE
ncbi:hypothetical protein [Mucilaginibacter sp. HD30]